MRVGVLGPLEIWIGDTSATMPTPKARLVFAALALHHGKWVSADRLIDAAWPSALPANPRAALQTNVARIRRAIERGGGDGHRLATGPAGYTLHLESGALDAEQFEDLVVGGRRASAAGDPGAAASRLREALRLWRGPLLDDLGDPPFVLGERARLDELRLDATEDRIDAELALGRHRELVAELETLAAAHPIREGMWTRLALALYRSDRQADALDRLRRLRDHLDDQLGLVPSTEVRRLEHRLLIHDATLDLDRHQSAPSVEPNPRRGSPAPTHPAVRLPRVVERAVAARLVGRVDELDRLTGLIITGDGADRSTAIVVVTGEAGIGKSRLVAEAMVRAHATGMVVLVGRCELDRVVAARPFVEIVDQLVEILGPDVLERVGLELAELGRLVPGLAGRVVGVGRPTDTAVGAGRYLLVRALAGALHAASEDRPVVVVVEDVHWADPMTIDLLQRVVDTTERPPMSVILTRRPGLDEHLAELVTNLSRLAPVTELTLDGLSPDEITALVDPDGRSSAWFGRAVYERCGGNPFFALELARHVAALGEADLARLDDLPLSVVAAVTHRVRDLGPGAHAVLRAAALIDTEFDAVVAVTAADHPEASAGLAAAERAGLITADGDGSGRYSFTHAIARSAIESTTGAGEREALHARIAQCLADQGTTVAPHAALAHHWARAGMGTVDLAVSHSTLAAADSMERRAYEDAVDRCDVGLGALDAADVHDTRRLELLLTSAEALLASAQFQAARKRADEAARLARELNDADALARSVTVALPVLPEPAVARDLEDAIAAVGQDHPLRATLLASLATMIVDTDPERADDLISAARVLEQRNGSLDAAGRILAFDTLYGDDSSPTSRIRAATELLARIGDQRSTQALDAYTFRGTAHLESGDVAAAERDFAVHAELAADLRTPGALAVDDQRRAMRALLAGRFDDAEAHVHRAMLHVGDDPAWVVVYGAQLIAIRLERGHDHEILGLLDALPPRDAERPITHVTRARSLAMVGEIDAAAELVRRLVGDHPSWRRDVQWVVTTGMLALAIAAIDDAESASAVYPVLAPYADRVAVFTVGSVCWGSVERFLAPLAATMGRWADAVEHHERSMAVHDRIGAPTMLVHDRLGLARALEARGLRGDAARARHLRTDAAAAAHELGISHALDHPPSRARSVG